jgi:hypothetical protein
MLETVTKEIEGTTYEVRQLDAVKGRKVFVRFAKLIAPALAEIQGQKDPNAALGRVVSTFAAGIDEETLDYFCDAFAPTTCIVEGAKKPELSKVFALHFAGKYFELVQWLVFCFEVNFGSFFHKLGPSLAS